MRFGNKEMNEWMSDNEQVTHFFVAVFFTRANVRYCRNLICWVEEIVARWSMELGSWSVIGAKKFSEMNKTYTGIDRVSN